MTTPELKYQQHIANFLIREHGYTLLAQAEITNSDYALVEEHLWAFISATQADTLARLTAQYGQDSRGEVFRALYKALESAPLWWVMRHGLTVRGFSFQLYYPPPRSAQGVASQHYGSNHLSVRPHFYFGPANEEIDFVIFLNGLPVVTLELKHEAGSQGWNVHDAVAQYAGRDHSQRIFQLPFLHIAADTSEVKVATDPRREENFRWFNTGLQNAPLNEGEYPTEYLYREVLSRDRLIGALAFFLVFVPAREAQGDKPARPAFSIFPRYHQSRMVRRVAEEAVLRFASSGEVGRKFLINHSAGSGKTLSICWLADRLHSLFAPGTNEKLVQRVVVLTDRKSLDKNIRDDFDNFTQLKGVVGYADSSAELEGYLKSGTPIIVSTQQKFAWLLERLERDPALKQGRVAFLIDEAHRSQEGQMGAAIRLPFRSPDDPDAEDAQTEAAEEDEEALIARIIREHDRNQLFVAFTATPSAATVQLFGEAFDTYTEAEAIEEGYIVDVAGSIVSYATLFHLHCPIAVPEKSFPAGVLAKALKNVAYQDDGLIQYKAEVMLRIFEERVKPLVGGRAKALIVATSRVAGLRYFEILQEKLKERGADYKVLYAFSDFTHPVSNAKVTEFAVNGLGAGELIEDRFAGDDYRLMVVANKFQTGFDQPLLAGMFLDKAVADRNAVQTVSRLNRAHDDKDDVVVVDFTNNAHNIIKAFAKYRQGTPYEPSEPDEQQCVRLHQEILDAGVFTQEDARDFGLLLANKQDSAIQNAVHLHRQHFQQTLQDAEARKSFVYLLAKFVKSFHFLRCFFTYSYPIPELAAFADYVGPQLIKAGTASEMMELVRRTSVVRASVASLGEVNFSGEPRKTRQGGGGGGPVQRVTIDEMLARFRDQFNISEEEALFIRQVTEEKAADPTIRATVLAHREDAIFLGETFKSQVRQMIQDRYGDMGRFEELTDEKYTDDGAIFDIMAVTVIQHQPAPGALQA
ncbi:MAG: putative Type restriction-modification system, site-specific deoxyribonuclease [Proteobacteria bacterium]|nr:putative Type restriction-modification system, site-specific deoxyribonuclease [Pseudomonadota bacterium]